MIINKTMCRIYQSILYLTFLSSEFIDLFVAIVFLILVHTISITCIISSHAITEVLAIHFKYYSTNTYLRIPTIVFFTLLIAFTFSLT